MTAPSGIDDVLSGLRRCRANGMAISPALLDMTIECMVRVQSCDQRRMERDRLICNAGALLAGDSPWERARKLHQEAKAMLRIWHILKFQRPHDSHPTIRDLLHAAALVSDLPGCQRSFHRILMDADSDIRSVAVSAGRAEDASAHSQVEFQNE